MKLMGRTRRGDRRLAAGIRADARKRFRHLDARGFSLPTAYRFADERDGAHGETQKCGIFLHRQTRTVRLEASATRAEPSSRPA